MKNLLFAILFACISIAAFAGTEKTIVIAGSDFQAPTEEAGTKFIEETLGSIKNAGYKNADAFLFCGDYTVQINKPRASEKGMLALKTALFSSGLGLHEENSVFIQGNHDPVGTHGIARSGAHDPASRKYGVFVINEDDFMWHQGRSPTNGNDVPERHAETVKQTAKNLENYLSEKHTEKFKNPIFILTHLPLHYTMRTYKDGDGTYAKFIFDVLNHYGAKGLNLIVLYGHNHSHGWDNYIGGGSAFLKPGAEICLANPDNRKKCTQEKTTFVYMNAGFTGYCTSDDSDDGADKTLSMTLFEISESEILIRRFSPKGSVNLKARGVYNTHKNNLESGLRYYVPDETVIENFRKRLSLPE